MNKMMKKLKSQVGETLAEVLIAMLISTIGLLMLAVMISSASNSITKSRNLLETYYSSEAGTSGTVTVTVSLKESAEGSVIAPFTYKNIPSNSKTLGGKTVLSYTQPAEGGTP